ncbi:hypothetical protein [Croceicoccus sp. BE223]|uniref:hypothetical protein n=1 Tax=Croceicoccus sp. BE223 TaxID=2817716 RepID=UPI00285F6D5A|nr:hypothetical protein [Croceicoccus sp. BE223]MDR7101845.1 hypothetical protein [Croceicoccus sp. BE223]
MDHRCRPFRVRLLAALRATRQSAPDAQDGYREEAISTFGLAHDNPFARIALHLLGQRIAVRDWRVDPGRCDAGSTTWPAIRDVRTTVTRLGPWGLPLWPAAR